MRTCVQAARPPFGGKLTYGTWLAPLLRADKVGELSFARICRCSFPLSAAPSRAMILKVRINSENRRDKWIVEETVEESTKKKRTYSMKGRTCGTRPFAACTDCPLSCWALGRIATVLLRRACPRTDVGRVGFPNARYSNMGIDSSLGFGSDRCGAEAAPDSRGMRDDEPGQGWFVGAESSPDSRGLPSSLHWSVNPRSIIEYTSHRTAPSCIGVKSFAYNSSKGRG